MAVVLLLCTITITALVLHSQGRLRRAVSVRITSYDGGYAATFAPPRNQPVQVLDHSMAFLSETGNGGDGLLHAEDEAFTTPLTVRFVHHTPGEKMVFDRGADRVRPLLPGQGGAAWIRYRAKRPDARSTTVLVLWQASSRADGKRPRVLRGSRADEWIRHIATPKSPAPTTTLKRIRAAITPAWLADPENRSAVNVVCAALGIVGVIVLVLVVLDLSSLRSFMPLTTEYDWLGFAGGLLGGVAGGVMTLAGVMLTLRNSARSERRRQQDDGMRTRLSVMPLLDLTLSDEARHFDNSHGQLAGLGWPIIPLEVASDGAHPRVIEHHLAIVAQNIGLGHARIRYVAVDRNTDFGATSRLGDMGAPSGLLQIGQEQVIRMSLARSLNAAAAEDEPDANVMLTLTIYYEDLLGNRYSQQLGTTLFLPTPEPESHGTAGAGAQLFPGVVGPPEFAGAPDSNPYWFH